MDAGGFTQTAPNTPLLLNTTNTANNVSAAPEDGGYAGVVLTGTYKLDVGGLIVIDTNDGRAAVTTSAAGITGLDSSLRTTRRLTSTGTLRISIFDQGSAFGTIQNYGVGTASPHLLVLPPLPLPLGRRLPFLSFSS